MENTTETVENENENPQNESDESFKRHGNNRYMQTIREALDKLIASVDVDNHTVDEYSVLGDIMVRSGLMWRCIRPGCNCINHDNCTGCDHCGARRHAKRAKPIADYWA